MAARVDALGALRGLLSGHHCTASGTAIELEPALRSTPELATLLGLLLVLLGLDRLEHFYSGAWSAGARRDELWCSRDKTGHLG
jgi:hypothetical protein